MDPLHNVELYNQFDKHTRSAYYTAYYNPVIKTKLDPQTGLRKYRVRGTYGNICTDYPGDLTANTADLTTIKVLLNATISEPNSVFSTLDIKDGTPLNRKEYMVLHISHLPDAFFLEFPEVRGLGNATGYFLKVIYGLPQAGKLAQDRLITLLAKSGYFPATHTPCLFIHETRPIIP
jgi:hypothetical protein